MINIPFVTVGIIARNEENNITNTLHYLLRQDYPRESMEIIIVDGNSTDKTREKAKEFLEKSDIQYSIINEKNCKNLDGGKNYGHSFARNCVIDALDTRSKYLAWIDADCRADTKWLSSLVSIMQQNNDTTIIGAGGRRIVETEGNISNKELMLNYYFTSKIMSLGNPAFSESTANYMPSIAGYNSIYTVEILKKYRYNTTYPFNTDDIEINYRLSQDGYKFLNAPEAKIYHRMDGSIIIFLRQMIKYGEGAMNVSKIHKKMVRFYIPISIVYIIGLILTPIFLSIGGFLSWMTGACWGLVILLSITVTFENIGQTKSIQSLWTLLIVPLHPLMYGVGVARGAIEGLKSPYEVLWYLGPKEYKNSGITLYNLAYKNLLEKKISIEEKWINHSPSSLSRIWIQYIWTPLNLILKGDKIKVFPDEGWLIIAVLFRIRNVICIIHDVRNFNHSTNQQSFIQKIYYSLIKYGLKRIKRIGKIVVPSISTKNNLIQYMGVDEGNITVAYNIIDEDIFFPINNKEKKYKKNKLLREYSIHISSDTYIILYVGSEEDRKNIITLLKALTKIKQKYICIKIGKPIIEKNRVMHEQYISANNLSVTFIDYIETMEELADWYRIADVFVFPSIFEGFGRTPVEAQACGCPVITTQCEGISEVIGLSACTINDPEDYNILGDKINLIFTKSIYRQDIITTGIKNAQRFNKFNNAGTWNKLL